MRKEAEGKQQRVTSQATVSYAKAQTVNNAEQKRTNTELQAFKKLYPRAVCVMDGQKGRDK